MKHTKIMIAFLLTLLVTWLALGSIVCMVTDLTLKASLTNPGLFMVMLLFGWIPAVIVASDLDENYE